jgi:uncharacterized protein YbjT (DUF2867 family)
VAGSSFQDVFMTKILILGANGAIARIAKTLFLENTDAALTLFLRDAKRLSGSASERVIVIDGDVLDAQRLEAAMAGQDVVYANLSGQMEQQARVIVAAMKQTGVKRLIFISSMGIHDEVPGESYGAILDPYRSSAKVIEASDLDYTVLRPAWLNNSDDISYGTTVKGQPFVNKDETVSRKSVADLIVELATTPGFGSRESLGVHGI